MVPAPLLQLVLLPVVVNRRIINFGDSFKKGFLLHKLMTHLLIHESVMIHIFINTIFLKHYSNLFISSQKGQKAIHYLNLTRDSSIHYPVDNDGGDLLVHEDEYGGEHRGDDGRDRGPPRVRRQLLGCLSVVSLDVSRTHGSSYTLCYFKPQAVSKCHRDHYCQISCHYSLSLEIKRLGIEADSELKMSHSLSATKPNSSISKSTCDMSLP